MLKMQLFCLCYTSNINNLQFNIRYIQSVFSKGLTLHYKTIVLKIFM